MNDIFYKNLKQYTNKKEIWYCNTVTKKNNWKLKELIEVPKGTRFIDKQAFIKSLLSDSF